MRIKLAIMDSDAKYVKKFTTYCASNYADKLEIYAFSNQSSFENFLKQGRIDVLLASEDLLQDGYEKPAGMQYAYLSESLDIEKIKGVTAICKYQKPDDIYKEVLRLFAEIETSATYKFSGSFCPVITFLPGSEDSGAVMVALGCAGYLASSGKNVLFLDLRENAYVRDLLEDGNGGSLSDVLYAIKSKKPNLSLKLESLKQENSRGIKYYQPFTTTLDQKDMRAEELAQLINVESAAENMDYIVTVIDSNISDVRNEMMDRASEIVYVASGNEAASEELNRRLLELKLIDERDSTRLCAKTKIIYSNCGSKSKISAADDNFQIAGYINKYSAADRKQIVNEISGLPVFEKLL